MTHKLDVDKFIDIICDEGKLTTLIGLMGGGKTNFASVIMAWAVERGYNVYTNCHFFNEEQIPLAVEKKRLPEKPEYYQKTPNKIHTIGCLSDLIKGLLRTEPNLVVLDESGVHISSSRATSSESVNWKYLAMLIRHLSSSMLIIGQSKESIIPDLRERMVEAEMRVRQIKKGDYMFTFGTRQELRNSYSGEIFTKFNVLPKDKFHGIPLSKYPIDGKDFPYFKQDLDVKKVFEELNQYNSLEVRQTNEDGVINGIAVVDDIVNGKGSKRVTKAQKRRELQKKLKKKDLIYAAFENGAEDLKMLAKTFDVGYSYVRMLHSTWKRGIE